MFSEIQKINYMMLKPFQMTLTFFILVIYLSTYYYGSDKLKPANEMAWLIQLSSFPSAFYPREGSL